MAEAKWEGKASVEVGGLTTQVVWSCLEDFCNLHKWFPGLDTCYQVEGVPGQPGLVRYVASTKPSSEFDQTSTMWAKEKLLLINPIHRCFSYEVIDNNIGFKFYVATIKVSPVIAEEDKGCMIQWSFVADPIQGWRLEDLVSYIDHTLQSMAKKMEQTFLSTD